MTAVILVAAGDGTRLGAGQPKALVALGGRTILEHSLDGVGASTDIDLTVVVAPSRLLGEVQRIVATRPDAAKIVVVAGATTRQSSVSAGLAAIPDTTDVVLVHDAARPLTPPGLFDLVRASVVASGTGIVPGLTPADTVKQVDASGAVHATLDRSRLAAVQTPQGFPFAALRAAYGRADTEYTDDAALFAADGNAVTVVAGDVLAFKITTGSDLARAESLLRVSAGGLRTGLGVDVHAFDVGVPLQLGGLLWPGQAGLAGHSDGDAVCHAITDALLSAVGLGDIGGVFGVDRPEEAGRAGVDFIQRAVAMLAEIGARPVNVSVQVIGNAPRIAPRRSEMEAVLSGALGAPVAVSGTTTDGLGFTGRGEGVTAIASALVSLG